MARKKSNRERLRRLASSTKANQVENPEQLSGYDLIKLALAFGLGLFALLFLFVSGKYLAFWQNRQGYSKTFLHVTEIARESSFEDGHAYDVYLVGDVGSTGDRIRKLEGLMYYDPRGVRKSDDAKWEHLLDKDKIGLKLPVWYASPRMPIYYVSEFPDKPSDLQVTVYLTINIAAALTSVLLLTNGTRKAYRIHLADLKSGRFVQELVD